MVWYSIVWHSMVCMVVLELGQNHSYTSVGARRTKLRAVHTSLCHPSANADSHTQLANAARTLRLRLGGGLRGGEPAIHGRLAAEHEWRVVLEHEGRRPAVRTPSVAMPTARAVRGLLRGLGAQRSRKKQCKGQRSERTAIHSSPRHNVDRRQMLRVCSAQPLPGACEGRARNAACHAQ